MSSLVFCLSLVLANKVILTLADTSVVRKDAPNTLSVKAIKPHDSSLMAMSVSAEGQIAKFDVAGSHETTSQDLRETKAQSLIDEVQGMVDSVRSGEELEVTPMVQEKLQLVKNIIIDEIIPGLKENRDYVEKMVINASLAEIDFCNNNTVTRMAGDIHKKDVEVKAEGVKHVGCRKDEKDADGIKNHACTALDDFLDGIHEKTLPHGVENDKTKHRDAIVTYVQEMDNYFCPKGDRVTNLDDKCTEKTSDLAKKKKECDKLQAQYESYVCTWRDSLVDVCHENSDCYADKLSKYQDKVKTTKIEVESWKLMYATLMKVVCYLDVMITGDVTKEGLDACDDMPVDTSPMDINFGVPHGIVYCDLPAVQVYPGHEKWIEQEYSNLTKYINDVITCLPATPENTSLLETAAGSAAEM